MDISTIPLSKLVISTLPVFVLIIIMRSWSLNSGRALYGVIRMVIQLLLIGYLLTYIFEASSGWIIGIALTIMVIAASWIALGNVPQHRNQLFFTR